MYIYIHIYTYTYIRMYIRWLPEVYTTAHVELSFDLIGHPIVGLLYVTNYSVFESVCNFATHRSPFQQNNPNLQRPQV